MSVASTRISKERSEVHLGVRRKLIATVSFLMKLTKMMKSQVTFFKDTDAGEIEKVNLCPCCGPFNENIFVDLEVFVRVIVSCVSFSTVSSF